MGSKGLLIMTWMAGYFIIHVARSVGNRECEYDITIAMTL